MLTRATDSPDYDLGQPGAGPWREVAMTGDRFEIDEPFQKACARAGIGSVADVLDRAACIRDLPKRANLRLEVGPNLVHVKHYKPRRFRRWRVAPEALGVVWARVNGLPAPTLVFEGLDRELGAVVGTLDLTPAEPLDDLLHRGVIEGDRRRRGLATLAAYVARLHGRRHHHKDLYLNHVFVDPERKDPIAGIIDWDRVGAHRRAWGRWVVKDLAALLSSIPAGTVSRIEQAKFLYVYVVMRMHPELPRRQFIRRFAARVEKKAARMRRHVPRTPVGDAARREEATS